VGKNDGGAAVAPLTMPGGAPVPTQTREHEP